MAEREGFEPSMGVKAHTPLAGERLQPLGHLSKLFRGRPREATFYTIYFCLVSISLQRFQSSRLRQNHSPYPKGFTYWVFSVK